MRRCVIIGSAPISNYSKIRSFLREDDFVIACDGGLRHLEKLKITPKLIVGDFDSHKNPNLPIETIVLPCEKDDTDSVFALKTAISRGFTDFLFVGMIGSRFDHSLANLALLHLCDQKNLHAVMLDDFSEMQLVKSEEIQIFDDCAYFSLLPICGTASGITIRGAKYNLENVQITPETSQLGVSNEVPRGKTASVSVGEGALLLVKVWGR